jgi:hypothetical protein
MPGNTHFLIVAIEKYHDPREFSGVSFAEKDAQEFKDAFIRLGANPDLMIILLNEKATANAIVHNLIKIVERVKENDRIVVYFSGHGLNIAGDNVLVPCDAIYDKAKDMCVSVNTILERLNKAKKVQKILFLDSCHSGIEPGEYARADVKTFAGDALAYQLKDAEYCVVFAACKTNQKSYSDKKLQNGVWSHFLIKALKGDGPDELYTEGCILATNLQDFLREQTYEYLQKYTEDKKDQVPIMFGSKTGEFIVADINSIFEERAVVKAAEKLKLKSVSIFIVEEGKIKDLDGFKKGRNFVPDRIGAEQDRFVKSRSGDIVRDDISYIGERLKKNLGYRRKEMELYIGEGEGYIKTSDFVFSIVVKQAESDSTKYEVIRSIDEINNPSIIHDPAFNRVFENYFDSLSLYFNKKINIEEWIDKLEEMNIDVDYHTSSPIECTFSLEGLDTDITIKRDRLEIFFTYPQSPHFIIDSYNKALVQLEMSKIRLLN